MRKGQRKKPQAKRTPSMNGTAGRAMLEKAAAQIALDTINSIKNSGYISSNTGYGNYGANTSSSSLRGWIYTGGSHREDIEDNINILRQRSRDEFMGVPLATGAIKTMRTNIVGTGLKLHSVINHRILGMTPEAAADLQRNIEDEFALWAESKDCDLQRLDDFYELQQLAFLSWLQSGDVVALLPTTKRVNQPYNLRINLIEADRVETPPHLMGRPDIVEGVETNQSGEVVAYHIANHHPLGRWYVAPTWQRVEAYGKRTGRRNVLHVMTRERVGQVRGVPFLAPVIRELKNLGRYTDAELMAAVISGLYAIFIEKEAESNEIPFATVEDMQDSGAPAGANEIKMKSGSIIDLAPGEHANVVQPGRPNANFAGFVEAMSKHIGAALEIPQELLLKQFSSSYSASRGALLEFWKVVNMYRKWLSMDFCQPIFEEWLAEAVSIGRINAPGFFDDPLKRKAYSGAEWHAPSNGQLNPLVEAQAVEKLIDIGLTTRQAAAAEMNGSNYADNVARLKIENELLREANGDAEY